MGVSVDFVGGVYSRQTVYVWCVVSSGTAAESRIKMILRLCISKQLI